VTDWGGAMTNEDKVPSVISYSNTSDGVGETQWGSNITGDTVSMMHTKLQLDAQKIPEELDLIIQALDGMKDFSFEHVAASEDMPIYTDKSAEEIVTDYLSLVFKYLFKTIEVFEESLRQRISVDIVITIPTVGFHDVA
jgi:hypothetical protein